MATFAEAAISTRDFAIEEFLAQEQRKDLLRFSTAGSVDDGKSTLIGRLLVDSQNVYEDQLRSVTKASVNRSAGQIDFSLLTDGLRAEREQGITIDVAYRYFSTARRKFIIADTPGHEQYTRNMATGASTAELAIILIDARKGVLPQSRRHAYIASLLGIRKLAVAVNKMDLVGYDQQVFERIRNDFLDWIAPLDVRDVVFFPISALVGDNVVDHSANTPWYGGASLLEYLEKVPASTGDEHLSFRFPVQRVIRPNLDFRGYAGQIASGTVRPGDAVYVLPSGRRSRIERIVTFGGDLENAHAPMSVTLTLADELDISRGDMLAAAEDVPHVARRFEATLVWFDAQPLEIGRRYHVKHASHTTPGTVAALRYRVDVDTLAGQQAATLAMNDIGVAEIETNQPLFFDPYDQNRAAGSFILIDAVTNATVAAGMIARPSTPSRAPGDSRPGNAHDRARVTAAERAARFGHTGAVVSVGAREELAYMLERRLFDRGCAVVVVRNAEPASLEALAGAGVIAITLDHKTVALPHDDARAASSLIADLTRSGVLSGDVHSGGEGI